MTTYRIRRAWINQPSTLQPLHHLHGLRVLAHRDTGTHQRVYPISGNIVSLQVPNDAVSDGWPEGD